MDTSVFAEEILKGEVCLAAGNAGAGIVRNEGGQIGADNKTPNK